MKLFDIRKLAAVAVIVIMQVVFMPVSYVFAATTPALGQAASFGILSSTYTNTAGGTTINGDLGYTTGPAVAPSVNGSTYSASSSKYSTAGTDQALVLAALNTQPCTFTFAPGAIDLATDTTHGPINVYAPGVYCITGAASVGAGGIVLTGGGTYIFRMTGALTTVANSAVTLASGASACDVFWTPGAATTLGANSTFVGTDIDAAGITIGSTVTWTGRALAFGGTVSTSGDTISVPTCGGADNAAGGTTSTGSSQRLAGSSTSTPSCPDVAPVSYPNLFQIDRAGSSATLYFTPLTSNLSYYYISYGLSAGDEQFGVSFQASPSSGVVKYTINGLNPNTTYYFKVRGGNGCAPGPWSNTKESNSKNPRLPNTGFEPLAQQTLFAEINSCVIQ